MRVTCPSCFAMHSLEALTNDPVARQVLDVLSKLPGQIANRTPAYMALFRNGKNGLSWSRALRIITQVQDLVSTGTVRFKKNEERPAPVSLWAEAMDITIEARPDAPKDHQYLIKVAWTNAAPLAAKAESSRETERRHRVDVYEDGPPATEEERRAVQNMIGQFLGKKV